METITAKEITKACKGRLIQGNALAKVRGVFIDSRLVEADGAFFALKGERVDGHDYIGQAVEKACSTIVVEKIPKNLAKDVVCIQVENTETALGDLASYYLGKFPIKKIGVTGSTGKTTTKEMLFHIVSGEYEALCNEGNFNNLIGLPLTVFRLDSSTEVAIFEMGMDRLGEIHRMAEIVKPHIALVTNVGLSHLEKLKSRENIQKAKGEIRDFLGPDDVLILNGEDEMMKSWAGETGGKAQYKILTVGTGEDAKVRISGIEDQGQAGIAFSYSYADMGGSENMEVQESVRLTVPGVHNVMNAAMALTGALELGMDIREAVRALEDFQTGDMRLNIIDCGDFKIIDDTYNASPDSVKAAIDVLMSVEGKRKIAILGDMFELGSGSAEYHREIGDYAFQKSVDMVLSVGENAREIVNAAKKNSMNAVHFHNKEMLIKVLSQWIRKGDLVLVKGSRGMAMEEIVKAIEAIKVMKID